MRRFLILSTAVAFLLGMAFAQDMGTMKAKTTEQALMDMENKWAAEGKANNPDGLADMLADNFVNLDSDGTMHDKTESLARMKKAKWETNEVSDMKVTTQGSDTAIVAGTWRGKGTDGMGKSVDATERFVDTWRKMPDGKWQCVASASAPMKQEQAAEK